jgi:hypothetical protein
MAERSAAMPNQDRISLFSFFLFLSRHIPLSGVDINGGNEAPNAGARRAVDSGVLH